MSPCQKNTCPQCGKLFACAVSNGETTCWCFRLPTVSINEDSADCLCPECLADLAQRQNPMQAPSTKQG